MSVTSTDAKRYRAYLAEQHNAVAARAGVRARQRFSVALNGLTATLSPEQARQRERSPEVLSVAKDAVQQPTDDPKSTDLLKPSGSTGVWAALGGRAKAGAGLVVGVIDTGIWPESRLTRLPPARTP
ncbi:MAG TPA: protease inhibitor I9 family protein [Propionibacteriaceae bacterium]|nr:protease inhibitor I9 family protein [Propionibacteriaceae bacterium]